MDKTAENKKLELISIGDASEYLGISVDTLRRWEKKGRIEPLGSPGGHRYYKKVELDSLFGKKYFRDEPTIRRASDKDLPITGEKPTSPLQEEVTVKAIDSPKITLPAWRALKEEIIIESIVEEKQEEAEQQVLERPVREISIPENTRIQISKNDFVMSPNEAYFSQQNLSVLTPPSNNQVQNATPPPNPEQTSFSKNDKITEIFNNKKIIYVAISAIVILFLIIWFLLWRNSQTLLSPVP